MGKMCLFLVGLLTFATAGMAQYLPLQKAVYREPAKTSVLVPCGKVRCADDVEPAYVAEARAILPDFAVLPSTRPDLGLQWTPPPSRAKGIPLPPLYLEGNNFFKGEAEGWLADAASHRLESQHVQIYRGRLANEYLQAVGSLLGKHSHEPQKKYEFVILDCRRPDSFTAGGGRIFVTRGMLQLVESEDELAGVLAHEIGHDNFHHAGRTLTRTMYWMLGRESVANEAETELMLEELDKAYTDNPIAEGLERISGISKLDEFSADRAAFDIMYKAGYNPLAYANLFDRMTLRNEQQLLGESGIFYPVAKLLTLAFSSHPPAEQRSFGVNWQAGLRGHAARERPREERRLFADESRDQPEDRGSQVGLRLVPRFAPGFWALTWTE